MTPAEVIARFRCSGRRFSGEWPCEICRGHAEQSVAALVGHGYAIVPTTASQALEASQDVETSGDGTTGPLAHADSATGLSAPHGWNRTINAHGIPIVWKILDEGDLIVGSPLVTPIAEENHRDA